MTFNTLEQIALRGQRVFIRCDLNVPLDPSGRISDDTRNRASLAGAIAGSGAFTLAGGGDTVAAIHQFEVDECIDCVSTAAGAFPEFLEGKTLPAVQVLKDRRH